MINIICPSPKGAELAFKLQKGLNAGLYIKDITENNIEADDKVHVYGEDFKLRDVTKEVLANSDGIVFISSTGIAVRAIAPFLQGKDKDAGVVVVDLSSRYAISLLSGHLGGGNELTLKVSEILGCEPVITTATDRLGLEAPDMIAKKNDLIIDDLKSAKHIAALLVNGKTVGIKDDDNIVEITSGYKKIDQLKEDSIWITHDLIYMNDEYGNTSDDFESKLDYSKILKLIKKDIILGIGCRRDTPYEKLKLFIEESLKKYNIDIRSVIKIASVDVKKNEKGIIELAQSMECPFITFDREEIKTVQDKYEKSEFVLKTLGITGVCEPSVDLAGGKVLVSKIKHEGMTLAIGQINAQ